MRLSGVSRRGAFAAENVDGEAHDFEMRWVYAAPIAARMIERHTIGDWASV
jgi:hypothetical protein